GLDRRPAEVAGSGTGARRARRSDRGPAHGPRGVRGMTALWAELNPAAFDATLAAELEVVIVENPLRQRAHGSLVAEAARQQVLRQGGRGVPHARLDFRIELSVLRLEAGFSNRCVGRHGCSG